MARGALSRRGLARGARRTRLGDALVSRRPSAPRATRSAGLYTADARVSGTIRCGYVARSLEAVGDGGVAAFLAGESDPAVEARLRRLGYSGPVHGVRPAAADALPTMVPSELSMLIAAQRAAAASPHRPGTDVEGTARLAALATLAGSERFAHAYEAALGWEKRGRPDQAAQTLADLIAAPDADRRSGAVPRSISAGSTSSGATTRRREDF